MAVSLLFLVRLPWSRIRVQVAFPEVPSRAAAFQLPPLPLLFLWNLQMLPRERHMEAWDHGEVPSLYPKWEFLD